MTRLMVILSAVVLLASGTGVTVFRVFGMDPHTKEWLAATITCVIGAELAILPLMLVRGGNQATVSQAALVGTVVHLFVCIAVAAVVILGHVGLGQSFLYWLLGLYWVTLIALVIAFAKAIRSAPITG